MSRSILNTGRKINVPKCAEAKFLSRGHLSRCPGKDAGGLFDLDRGVAKGCLVGGAPVLEPARPLRQTLGVEYPKQTFDRSS